LQARFGEITEPALTGGLGALSLNLARARFGHRIYPNAWGSMVANPFKPFFKKKTLTGLAKTCG